MRNPLPSTAFALALAPALAAAGGTSSPDAPRRPNILVLVADDLGARDLACYNPGTFYETPNLDRLAAQGVRFTNGYAANPVCSPTRFSLMTGRYPSRVGATYWFGTGGRGGRTLDFRPAEIIDLMPPGEITVADCLRSAGYQTAFVGKWHLGDAPALWPEHRGFDTNIAGYSKGHPNSYFSPYKNPRLADGPPGEHLTDRLAAESVALLRKLAADPRPFLLWHSFYAVHTPLQAPAALVEKYREKAARLGLDDGRDFAKVSSPHPSQPSVNHRIRQSHPLYAALVEQMDTAAGRILAEIDALGLAQNTLDLFIGDNGGLATGKNASTSNLPLRAGKAWLYEGGIREPFILRYPAAQAAAARATPDAKPAPPAAVNDTPVMSTDFLPTILAAAGVSLPKEREMDGVNLLPLLRGEPSPAPARDALYWHFPHYGTQGAFPASAIRAGDWKLLEHLEDGRVHLFNLRDDPGEQHDLAAAEPARAAALRARLHVWQKATHARFLRQKPGGPAPWRPDDAPATP